MRQREIKINRAYSDGETGVRLVVGVGEVGVRYLVLVSGGKRNAPPRESLFCTRKAFATWAQHEVTAQCDWVWPQVGGYLCCVKGIGHSAGHKDHAGGCKEQSLWVHNEEHVFYPVQGGEGCVKT